ncbi:glycosyltransferase family 2 protein [Candidatus Saccharibacteria bacterium]|nr:glycosyltransferase family 2 protein [Candidatus Saccharibacteria bacterium]
MKALEKVSIIIPVYNTSPSLLEKCVESVLSQTYSNMEILVIDDGSSSEETLKKLSDFKKNKRIKIIHKDNSGVSETRNVGIRKAEGDYIVFLDSDDRLAQDFVEYAVSLMDDKTIVILRTANVDSEGVQISLEDNPKRIYWPKNDIFDMIKNSSSVFCGHGAMIPNKIAKSYSYNKELAYGEDMDYMFNIMKDVKVIFDPKIGYFYVKNLTSVTHGFDEEKTLKYYKDMLKVYGSIARLYNKADDRIHQMLYEKINIAMTRRIICGEKSFKAYKTMLKKLLSLSGIKRVKIVEHVPSKQAIKIFCLNHRLLYAHYAITRLAYKVNGEKHYF